MSDLLSELKNVKVAADVAWHDICSDALSKAIQEIERLTDENRRLDRLAAFVSWLKPNDYGTGFYCSEEICEQIIDLVGDDTFRDLPASTDQEGP